MKTQNTKPTITAVIVEDDPKGADLLAHIVETYCDNIQLVGVANDVDHAYELIHKHTPQILFLDIQLKNKTCFDLLDQIEYDKLKIVITTAYDTYAVQAFKYHAVDYILKPIDVDAIVNVTQKLFKDPVQLHISSLKDQVMQLRGVVKSLNANKFVAISTLDELKVLQFEDIVYLESDGRYTIFTLKDNQKIVASKNLGVYETELMLQNFFRVHKKYIVNLKHLVSIDKKNGGNCNLINGVQIPISFRRRSDLLQFLNLK